MKLWNEFLGFMVLSGPLVVMAPWLLFCVWAGAKAAKRFTSGSAKFAVGLGVVVTLMAPVADEIAGRIYLNHLCATEAGVKVYRTVELPAEYWDAQGRPKFIKENGDLDQTLLGKRFEGHWVEHPYSSSILKMNEARWQFSDSNTHEILGEKITFRWLGGWIEDFSPAPGRGASCPLLSEQYDGDEFIRRQYEQEKEFYSRFFKLVNSSK